MAASATGQAFPDAHAALLRDGALQFELPAAAAPRPPVPAWNLSLGFDGIGLVWVLAAVGAVLVLGLAISHLRDRPATGSPAAPAAPADVPIAPAAARLALGDADRLAADGRHLEAARALLACGLDAIARAHPGLLRPTTTSRDLAREPALPGTLRAGFARIARAVETGLFAGRPIGPDDYADCRRAFVASTLDGRP